MNQASHPNTSGTPNPMPKTLDKDHLRRLKAAAHALKPIVWVGQNGLTENLMIEIDQALAHHELMKIKIMESDRDLRHEMAETIANTVNAICVGHIGNISILYRRRAQA